jgi:hypothetical protein
MKIPHLNAILALSVSLALLSPQVASAVIFGTDTTREVGADPITALLARSTALMTSNQFETLDANGRWKLAFDPLSSPDIYDMCPDTRFASQPVPPIACSGFLVGPDLLVTAGHCMMFQPGAEIVNGPSPFCDTFIWIFDYRTAADGTVALDGIPSENIVRCKRVIDAVFEPTFDPTTNKTLSGRDFALIELEHPMQGRAPLKLASADPALGTKLTAISYPIGLPAKVDGPAPVTDVTDAHAFTTHLNGIGGESGAPVFNSQNEVVGILVRSFPGDDFFTDPTKSCQRINHCDANGLHCDDPDLFAPGTSIQRIRDVAPLIHL